MAARRRANRIVAGMALLLAIQASAGAQTLPVAPGSGVSSMWRKLGNESVGLNLAGPVGGPVAAVWFSASGDRLFVRTSAGQLLETSDFFNWIPSKTTTAPPAEIRLATVRSSEANARVVLLNGRYWALGENLEVSDDGGRTFTSLTAYNGSSIIGPNQHSLAISPVDSRLIVVGNDFGVWRSADGGLSWSGLNEDLPNLPLRRLLPSLSGSVRGEVEGIGPVELPPAAAAAHANWIPTVAAPTSNEQQRRAASKTLGTEITALAQSSTTWFAGSIDGRLWNSFDSGATWTLLPQRAGGRIEAIQAGGNTPPEMPHGAVAVAALPATPGATGPRVLRTINDGEFWEDIGASLPEGAVHGVAVDPVAGVAYVAGDRGVFTARVDLSSMAPVAGWQKVPGLPEAHAMDIQLDQVRNQLYVAMDGYGLYVASAPHLLGATRILTAADQPAQSAAPGVLLNIKGNGLSSVKAEPIELATVSSSQTSAQIQVPFEASGTVIALTINSMHGASQFALPLKDVAPSILVDADGLPIVVDAVSGLTLDARNIARPGARIQVFASGLGRVDPEWRTGVPAPENPPVVTAKVEARLGAAHAEVLRATLAPGYVGLYLVEVQLPGLVNAGSTDFFLVVNGEASNHVKMLLTTQ